jgi:hypothetical protein
MADMNESLVVVWTGDNKTTALEMVFRYTINAKKKGWMKDVTFLHYPS